MQNYTINYWISEGVHPRKIVMGMPLYGQSFTLTDSTKNDLNCASTGPGTAGEFTRAGGFLAYYEVRLSFYSISILVVFICLEIICFDLAKLEEEIGSP